MCHISPDQWVAPLDGVILVCSLRGSHGILDDLKQGYFFMQHKDDYVIVWQPLTTVSSHSKAGRWTRTWFLTHEFLNLLISSSQMSKNETQGQVLTIQAHASSTFSVLQIMRQLSAVRAQAARVMPVFTPEPSPAQDTAALQGDHSPVQSMQFCSENVSPLQCQHSLVPGLLHSVVQCLKYCDLWTHWTLSSFNAITAAAIKCGFYVWVKNSSSILFKIFVFAWHQGSGNIGNTVQCCSGGAGGEMELQCCSARSALPLPAYGRTIHSAIGMRYTKRSG